MPRIALGLGLLGDHGLAGSRLGCRSLGQMLPRTLLAGTLLLGRALGRTGLLGLGRALKLAESGPLLLAGTGALLARRTLVLTLLPCRALVLALLPCRALALILLPSRALALILLPSRALALILLPSRALALALLSCRTLALALLPSRALALILLPSRALALTLLSCRTLALILLPCRALAALGSRRRSGLLLGGSGGRRGRRGWCGWCGRGGSSGCGPLGLALGKVLVKALHGVFPGVMLKHNTELVFLQRGHVFFGRVKVLAQQVDNILTGYAQILGDLVDAVFFHHRHLFLLIHAAHG